MTTHQHSPMTLDDVLQALADGWFLKSHRDLDGTKEFKLHPLQGEPIIVDRETVEHLVSHGFVSSNQKFPVATYTITEQGRLLAQSE